MVCSCLFLIGIVSEFMSFFQQCFSQMLFVKPLKSKHHNHQDKTKLDSTNQNGEKKCYNSFEMTVTSSTSSLTSSNKSLLSCSDNSESACSNDPASTTNAQTKFLTNAKKDETDCGNNNGIVGGNNGEAHFNLIKYHPANLLSTVDLLRNLNLPNRTNLTRLAKIQTYQKQKKNKFISNFCDCSKTCGKQNFHLFMTLTPAKNSYLFIFLQVHLLFFYQDKIKL